MLATLRGRLPDRRRLLWSSVVGLVLPRSAVAAEIRGARVENDEEVEEDDDVEYNDDDDVEDENADDDDAGESMTTMSTSITMIRRKKIASTRFSLLSNGCEKTRRR